MSRRLAVFALPLALLAGCSKKSGPPPKEAVPVLVAAATKRDVPLEIRVVGHVDPLQSVAVRPRIGGAVTSVAFREGDEVRAGDLLFSIDPAPAQQELREAEANLARDRAHARNARQEANRYAALVEKDYVTKQQYEQLRAAADAAEATLHAGEAAVSQARLDLGYASVRSPISGRTGAVLVRKGNLVRANDEAPLVVVNQVRPIAVAFSVPESELGAIRAAGGIGRLRVTAIPQDGSERKETGVLSFVDNAVDRSTGTILLKGTFENGGGALWPGQFVDVALTLATDAGAVTVPAEALQTTQKGRAVWLVADAGTAEVRPVDVAREVTLDGRPVAVIRKGLSGGETVVIDGQLRLSPGAKTEIKSELRSPSAARSGEAAAR